MVERVTVNSVMSDSISIMSDAKTVMRDGQYCGGDTSGYQKKVVAGLLPDRSRAKGESGGR